MSNLNRLVLIAGILLGRLRVSFGRTLRGISAVLIVGVSRVLNRTAHVLAGLWGRFANPLTLAIVAACVVVPLMQATWGRTAGGLAAFWCLAHLGGLLRSGFRPARRAPAGAASQSSVDEVAFMDSLTPHPDRVLRQRARQITDDLRAGLIAPADRVDRQRQRQWLYQTLDARRTSRERPLNTPRPQGARG